MTCARQMTLSKGGLIAKGIYYIDGLCAIQMLLGRDSDPSLGGVLYVSRYGTFVKLQPKSSSGQHGEAVDAH